MVGCRFCGTPLQHSLIDLVSSPPSNSFLPAGRLDEPETFYPLKVWVCQACWLVQIAEYKSARDIFGGDYAYFSSYSLTWLEHARRFVEDVSDRFGVDTSWQVVEIASNDGYLLQFFEERGIPVLGVEPAENVAEAAMAKGIETELAYFGRKVAEVLAARGRHADLLIANNVLAHVPDLNDFVSGLKALLRHGGILTIEFPHVMRLIDGNHFDTIYHEHFSYLSLHTVRKILGAHRLEVFDVRELPTHGGSLRIFAGHAEDSGRTAGAEVERLLEMERESGMTNLAYYTGLQERADRAKYRLLEFLIEERRAGRTVVGYGAAAKGNTLLNYCGIKGDLLPFVVDASPHKRGLYLPGSHIPVVDEERIGQCRPENVLILPWNLRDEIMDQLDYVREWGGRFVVAIPELQVF